MSMASVLVVFPVSVVAWKWLIRLSVTPRLSVFLVLDY